MTYQEILNQLTTEGLRIAEQTESGWTYPYINEDKERVTLWITDVESGQAEMFPEGEDLPLFSGTPRQGTIDPFKAKKVLPKQMSLFGKDKA